MEIKPIRAYQLPKFALTVAAVAVAGTMTACRTEGEVQTSGVAPMPSVTEDVQLMGEVAVEETPAYKTTEPSVVLDGGAAVYDYETEAPSPAAMPDFIDVFEQSNLKGVSYEALFKEAFAAKGITLIPKVLDPNGEADFVWTSEDGRTVRICFFDPDVRRDGWSMHDAIAAFASREYQWGMVMEMYSAAEDAQQNIETYQVYVNIDWCAEEMNAERAAKIAGDVLQQT